MAGLIKLDLRTRPVCSEADGHPLGCTASRHQRSQCFTLWLPRSCNSNCCRFPYPSYTAPSGLCILPWWLCACHLRVDSRRAAGRGVWLLAPVLRVLPNGSSVLPTSTAPQQAAGPALHQNGEWNCHRGEVGDRGSSLAQCVQKHGFRSMLSHLPFTKALGVLGRGRQQQAGRYGTGLSGGCSTAVDKASDAHASDCGGCCAGVHVAHHIWKK